MCYIVQGAYTARMVATMIVRASFPSHVAYSLDSDMKGKIGVLDRTDMDNFASIFINFQKRGKATDPKGKLFFFAKTYST